MVGIEQSGCCVGTKIETIIVWDMREDLTSFDMLKKKEVHTSWVSLA